MKKPKLPFKGATIEYDNKNYSLDFKLQLEPEQEKLYITGKILAERLKEKGLSASVLDYLLENTYKIPDDWKDKIIYFWGTIFRYARGILYVRCLVWCGGEWQSYYRWLDCDLNFDDHAVVSASPLNSDTQISSETMSFDQALKIVKSAGCKVTRIKEITEEL